MRVVTALRLPDQNTSETNQANASKFEESENLVLFPVSPSIMASFKYPIPVILIMTEFSYFIVFSISRCHSFNCLSYRSTGEKVLAI